MERGRGEVLLVVDDEEPVREATRHTLVAQGYCVEVAASAAEALAMFAQTVDRFRLVITDTMMAGMDGPATASALRRQSPRRPIIAVSGLARDQRYDDVPGAGKLVFLHKPYCADMLLELVRKTRDETTRVARAR